MATGSGPPACGGANAWYPVSRKSKMGASLSSLVERERLQEIVNDELKRNPLRCPSIENYRDIDLSAPHPTATGEIEQRDLENALASEAIVLQKVTGLVTSSEHRWPTRVKAVLAP